MNIVAALFIVTGLASPLSNVSEHDQSSREPIVIAEFSGSIGSLAGVKI